MVFGLFTRKPTAEDAPEFTRPARPGSSEARLPTPTSSTLSLPASGRQSPLRFPTSLRTVFGGSASGIEGDGDSSPASHPPATPSPPPPPAADAKQLYDLMLTIPAKTLHAYTLAHLHPSLAQSSSTTSPPAGSSVVDSLTAAPPPSPETVSKLQRFFATLTPPPFLHCVRCHADFYAIENEEKDKACRVPHDDESALVSRVPGAGYETLWGCCGQTADGDGGEGPPDGWCYEGRHTVGIRSSSFFVSVTNGRMCTHTRMIQTDIKRARFRADSTIHDDKLTSCLKLHCHGIRDRLPRPSSARKSNSSPARSHAVQSVPRVSRKRSRKSLKDASPSLSAFEDADDHEDTHERPGSVRKGKSKQVQKDQDMNMSMLIDDPSPSPVKPSPRTKATSRPSSRARPPRSTSTTASFSTFSGPGSINAIPPVPPVPSLPLKQPSVSVLIQANAGGSPRKPRVDAAGPVARPKTISRMLVSQSDVHAASDSDTSSRAMRPRTRSLGREHSDARRSRRSVMKLFENEVVVSSQAEESGEGEVRGRKKRRTGD